MRSSARSSRERSRCRLEGNCERARGQRSDRVATRSPRLGPSSGLTPPRHEDGLRVCVGDPGMGRTFAPPCGSGRSARACECHAVRPGHMTATARRTDRSDIVGSGPLKSRNEPSQNRGKDAACDEKQDVTNGLGKQPPKRHYFARLTRSLRRRTATSAPRPGAQLDAAWGSSPPPAQRSPARFRPSHPRASHIVPSDLSTERRGVRGRQLLDAATGPHPTLAGLDAPWSHARDARSEAARAPSTRPARRYSRAIPTPAQTTAP